MNFTDFARTKTDSFINFIWGERAPNDIDPDTFSVCWTGEIEAKFTGVYTFYVTADDGVRLWVNDRKIIDRWFDQNSITSGSTIISLVAGQKYDIQLEYYENQGGARVILEWYSSKQLRGIVPKNALYPEARTCPKTN